MTKLSTIILSTIQRKQLKSSNDFSANIHYRRKHSKAKMMWVRLHRVFGSLVFVGCRVNIPPTPPHIKQKTTQASNWSLLIPASLHSPIVPHRRWPLALIRGCSTHPVMIDLMTGKDGKTKPIKHNAHSSSHGHEVEKYRRITLLVRAAVR